MMMLVAWDDPSLVYVDLVKTRFFPFCLSVAFGSG